MPDKQPMSTYPFATFCTLIIGSLYIICLKKTNTSFLLKLSLFAQIIFVLILPMVTSIGGNSAYITVFFILFLFGFTSGVMQTILYSYNSRLPDSYIGVFNAVQGVCGVASTLLKFSTLKIFSTEEG